MRMSQRRRSFISPFPIFMLCSWLIIIISRSLSVSALEEQSHDQLSSGALVKKKDERRLISSSQFGQISAVTLGKTTDLTFYNVQFITLELSAIFLPVVLYANMVFYVQTGSGRLSYIINDGRKQTKKLRQGDVFGLSPGTVFFIEAIQTVQCMEKLKIVAVFDNSEEHFREAAAAIGPYSSFRDLLLGFNKNILQQTFQVPTKVIEEIVNATSPPAIVSVLSKRWKLEARLMEGFTRSTTIEGESNLPNMLSAGRDFENRHGWIATFDWKKIPECLKGLMASKFGFFMSNLTRGSMVAPHWNPMATEIAIVLQGKGMIRVVCSSKTSVAAYNETQCNGTRFKVEEGDVFVVPSLHPTAQMSFGDDTFVFMGFSIATTKKKTSHQFLVGKVSIFRALGKSVLAASLGVNETIIGEILSSQLGESAILSCNLCAEEELRIMEEEIAKAQEQKGSGAPGKSPGLESGKETETHEPEVSGMIKLKNIRKGKTTWASS